MQEKISGSLLNQDQSIENVRQGSCSPPYIKFQYESDTKTGKRMPKRFVLSDGTQITQNNFHEYVDALYRATGSKDHEKALYILHNISLGLSPEQHEDRLNAAACLLSAFNPKDEIEGMLLGQFVSLFEAGQNCLRKLYDERYPGAVAERFGSLSSKLFAQANAAMMTLLKYRTAASPSMQVHVHNQQGSQSLIAQNFIHSSRCGCKINN